MISGIAFNTAIIMAAIAAIMAGIFTMVVRRAK